MQIKCEYCDSLIDDSLEKCPNCGATNLNMARQAVDIPRTIEELAAFCREKNLDLEALHFYIGEDHRGPKAFGIYKDGENFIVYKNKSDGSRAVRYRGSDEAYAVNELYQKLKTVVFEAKQQGSSKTPSRGVQFSGGGTNKRTGCLIAVVIAIILPFVIGFFLNAIGWEPETKMPANGYYSYNNEEYYHDSTGWFRYFNNAWHRAKVNSELEDHFDSYFDSMYDGDLIDDYFDDYDDDDHPYDDDCNDYDYDDYDYDDDWDDDWDDDDWDYDWDYDWDDGFDWDSDW